jgi:predicted metal-dependent enzyme (double-stranded beta helix superfamily)
MTGQAAAGVENLLKDLDRAAAGENLDRKTSAVSDCLSRLIVAGAISLPEKVCRPRPDCYARRFIHRNESLGYEVLAMIWGPGQGTPIHDHAGVWCVEAVYQGEIKVVRYDLIEERGGLFRLTPQAPIHAHLGMSGSLIPPSEYHTIKNLLQNETSITLHVYGLGMDHCHIFEPHGDNRYLRVRKELGYD